MKSNTVIIIGVGLIGGSIALGLKKAYGNAIHIIGYSKDPRNMMAAKRKGSIDAVLLRPQLPNEPCFVILATPIRETISLLSSKQLNADTHWIMDVASTKETICATAERVLPNTSSFIGTHPMAGKETRGFMHASDGLFRKKPWVICSTSKTKPAHLDMTVRYIRALGAHPETMTPVYHDEAAAWASHLPMTVATLLMQTLAHQPVWKGARSIASSGFRDTTRLAASDPSMKRDILETNRHNIVQALVRFRKTLTECISELEHESYPEIMKGFVRAQKERQKLTQDYD